MAEKNAALRLQSLDKNTSFASDVLKGLTSKPKSIPSKYFYDAKGDFLFQQIMQLEEYYLTDCEFEILDSAKTTLLDFFSEDNNEFDLVELGAGDATKTKILIRHFIQKNARFNYIPIDISPSVLTNLSVDLTKEFPKLQYKCLCGDYLDCIATLQKPYHQKKALLFLGSNIGNFTHSDALVFFKSIRKNLSPGDFLLVGFDLKKNPEIILKAYNDSQGITSDFNLNLLERINRELGGNFNIKQFKHFPVYDPLNGEARSYLISQKAQSVVIKSLNQIVHFDIWEPLFTEVSRKYSAQQINSLAQSSGFKVMANFFDRKKYFSDSLWIAK